MWVFRHRAAVPGWRLRGISDAAGGYETTVRTASEDCNTARSQLSDPQRYYRRFDPTFRCPLQ